MKNRKHIFIPLLVFIGACIVSLIWSVIDFTAVNRDPSFSSQILQLDFDGASEGKDPNGDAFNAADFLTNDIIEKALNKSDLANKYNVEDVKKFISVDDIVPENIVDEINSYESLISSSSGRGISSNDYHPIRFRFKLYQDLDNKLSSKTMNIILGNIVDTYCEKFYEVYKKTFEASIYDDLFVVENYDYIYQTAVFANKIDILSSYARSIYEEHDDFKYDDKTFNDLVLKGNQLNDGDVSRINNIIILNALSKDLDRLKDFYEYKIETLKSEKTKNVSDLNAVSAQLSTYKKDSTIYVGSGESVVKVNSNSEATYNELLEMQISFSNSIALINVQISDCESILQDINNAIDSDDDYILVKNYIDKLGTDYVNLKDTFVKMLDAYNEKYIIKTSLSKGEIKYTSNNIFSGSFITRCIKIGSPIILGTLLGICCFYLVRTLKKDKEKNINK